MQEEVRVKVFQMICKKLEEITEELRIDTSRGRAPTDSAPSPLVVLEEMTRECREPQAPSLLLLQEYSLGEGEGRVDMLLAGKVVLELKSRDEEFPRAVEKAMREYLPKLPNASHLVVTNGRSWEIYEVKGASQLVLLERGTLKEVEARLKNALLKELYLSGLRVPLAPAEVVELYKRDLESMASKLQRALEEALSSGSVPVVTLFEAYVALMKKLYPYSDLEKLKRLYVHHTLFHMMAVSSLAAALNQLGNPVDVASGATLPSGLAVALPYLNWWKIYYARAQAERRRDIEEVATRIASRAALVDWSKGGEEEIFRALYESLLDPEDRRKLGEYYTPIWMVDRILSEFKLRDKVVLDPFCGSGTFLARAFYKKLREGEDPRSAYESLIGIDVNPLAVAVARAVLIISYVREAGRQPHASPHVYHFDTFAAWLGGRALSLHEEYYLQAADALGDYIKAELLGAKVEAREVLRALSELERALATGTAQYLKQGLGPEDRLKELILDNLWGSGKIFAVFAEAVRRSGFTRYMTKLVEKYGDGVWAVIVTSAVALRLLRRTIEPEIVVTNPPWMRLSTVGTDYAGKMREYVKRSLMRAGASEQKAHAISLGTDVSVVALALSLKVAREGVGFVMPAEHIFSSRMSVKAGMVAAYAALMDACPKCSVKLIHVKHDAFSHNIDSSLAFAFKDGREGGLLVAELGRRASKGESLQEVGWRETQLDQSYEQYMKLAIEWAGSAREEVAWRLDVREVKLGGYIRGIAGGERRRGAESYAGLRVEELEEEGTALRIRLAGLKKAYLLPRSVMEKHRVGVYELHNGALPYMPERKRALLSKRGSKGLKEFIAEVVEVLESTPGANLEEEDRKKLLGLARELSARLEELKEGKPYVIYRHMRLFVAYVAVGRRGEAVSDIVALTECKEEDQAYYYAALLNYLAFCVKRAGRSYLRTLVHRPLEAIIKLRLSWREAPEELRREVARLSRELERYMQGLPTAGREELFEELSRSQPFQQLVKALDKYIEERVGRERLAEALDLVSTKPGGGRGR